MSENGTLKNRRPQLADSIQRLGQMVDGLATAIPGAVADSVREALGPALAAAIKDAVRDAVREAVKEAVAELGTKPPAPPALPAPPAPPKSGAWARVKAALGRLKRWAAGKAVPTVARLALGWAVVKLIGASTIRSRAATLTAALTGAAAGLAGFAGGPVGSAVLLGMAAGAIAAAAAWATPVAGLLAALRNDWAGREG